MTELVLASVADAAAALDHAHRLSIEADVARILAVAALCDLHRVDATVLVEGAERWVQGGADGTPLIGEFVAADVAVLQGLSVGAAFTQIARILNLRHRHPTLWWHVIEGAIRSWDAFRVADAASAAGLDLAACLRVDQRCATALMLQPWARVRGQVEKWILHADEALADQRRQAAARRRYVTIGGIEAGHTGLWGQLDAADGVALHDALNHLADGLDGDTHDVRRAAAIGVMARGVLGQRPLPHSPEGNRARRNADLIIRLDAGDDCGVASIDRWGHVLLPHLEHILIGAHVTVRPVLVAADIEPVDGYHVPESMKRALETRQPVDVFPYGAKASHGCDLDHTKQFDHEAGPGSGQSNLGNLGPMARFTHRVLTHGGWSKEQPRPGFYAYRTRLGYRFTVTAAGTVLTAKPPPREHAWWQHEPPDGSDEPPASALRDGACIAGAPPDPGPRQAPLPYRHDHAA